VGGEYDTLAAGRESRPTMLGKARIDDVSERVRKESKKKSKSLFKHAGLACRLTADLHKGHGILKRGARSVAMTFLQQLTGACLTPHLQNSTHYAGNKKGGEGTS
jgi:hypothetical protein